MVEQFDDSSSNAIGRRNFLKLGGGVAGLAAIAALPAWNSLGSGNRAGAATLPRVRGYLDAASSSKTLAVGLVTQAPNLDPLQGDDDTYAYAVFDALTNITADTHEAVGNLAKSWKRVSTTVTDFTLRTGITFSNGTKLTAADVAFSFNTVLEKGYQIASIIPTITSVVALNTQTVRITTKYPDPILAKRVALIFIVPQKYYTSAGSSFGSKPIGTGYYTISSFTPNAEIGFVANPHCWKGAPATSLINTTLYSTESALLSAIESGQLEVAQDLPPQAISVLKATDRMANVNIGSPLEVVLQTLHGPFKDLRVREAVNLAVNVPEIIKKLLGGAGVPLQGQLPGSNCFGYNPKVKAFGYNPRKAKQLLAAAGYPHGFSTEIAGLGLDKETLTAVAGYLRAVGLKVNVLPLEFDVWLKGFTNGSTWPMFLVGVNYSPLYDASLSYRYVTGTGIPNWHKNFTSPVFDKLFAKQSIELDSKKREALLMDIATVLKKEIPSIFLYDQEWIYAWKSSVSGVMRGARYHLQLSDLRFR